MKQELARRFHIMDNRAASRAAGFELANRAALLQKPDVMMMPPPGRRGFRDYPEPPLFIADARKGRLHWDLDRVVPYYWFVSAPMKSILETLDREAFAFLPCRVRFPDGSDAPPHWLCDVVRVLDAVDEEKSKVAVRVGSAGNKFYSFVGGVNLFFKLDVVGTSRFFRLHYQPDCVICDNDVKAACEAVDLKGLRFVAQGRPLEKPRAFTFYLDGNAHRKKGDLAAAIAAYGEAIRLGRRDTFYPQYLQSRAAAYVALNDVDSAIADYDEAIRINPPDGGPRRRTAPKQAMRLTWLADAFWQRGTLLGDRGDHARAEQDFETARTLGYDRDLPRRSF
jgi:hypothetical protein